MDEKLLLIDGSSLAYRSYYAFINNPLTTSEGKPTSAIYGFSRSLKKVLDEIEPEYAVVCFDLPEPTFRKDEYPDYKANREEMPDDLSRQIPDIYRICEASGINVITSEGYEADDIIATLVNKANKKSFKSIIFTLDKDLMQLTSENVKVLNMKKQDTEYYDEKRVEEKFGIPPEKLVDFLAIIGDSSDNIPGIKGIGKKTASRLLKKFDSLEDIFANLESLKGKAVKNKLKDREEEALKWKELIRLRNNVPLDIEMKELKYNGIDDENLRKILEELEFYSLIEEWIESDTKIIEYELIDEKKMEPGNILSILTIDNKIALASDNKITISKVKLASKMVREENVSIIITDDSKKTAHNLGFFPEKEIFDLSLMHYLINPNSRVHNVDRIMTEYGISLKDKQGVPVILFDLKDKLEKSLIENELMSIYKEIEIPLVPVLYSMEKRGMLADISLLKKLRTSIKGEINEIKSRIYEYAEEKFNVRSPKQLGEILFDKLGLPVIKKTKTGYSTDAEVLNHLYDKHPIIPEILNFREIDKIRSSYINCLIDSINSETGRIHTEYQQTIASTGRITTTNPNLQTLPIRSERGRKIREAVIAPPGYCLLSVDYSQIELRILAHLAQDENLLSDFENDRDIHSSTARRIFGLEAEEIDSSKRREAKAVNFGIVYGISPYGLARQLDIPVNEASDIISNYYMAHPGVDKWQKETIEKAEKNGYVSTIFGRKRWIPELKSSRNKEYGKRIAINSPIQGSAADIIKKAMIEIYSYLKNNNSGIEMILQIHDELLFEIPDGDRNGIEESIIKIMENVTRLSVPLKVDYNFGKNWDEAH